MNAALAFTAAADVQALQRVMGVRPRAVGVRYVRDVAPSASRRVYHAGPPYRSTAQIPLPVLHSAAQAVVFEGWCRGVEEAIAALRTGVIEMASAQDHRLLVPLSGVLTASMAVLEIADPELDLAPVWVALNEGQRHATRLGRLDEDLLPHLRWLNTVFAPWLDTGLKLPLDLLPVTDHARRAGDDCHARTVEGSRLIAQMVLERAAPVPDEAVRTFLQESQAFALNFWMGATALAARAAEGVMGASLITRAGGNGVEFGLQLAGRVGTWVCAPAPVPRGVCDPAFASCQAVGALGDSALVDFAGLGGQSLSFAPLVEQGVSSVLPPDAMLRAEKVLPRGRLDLVDGLQATSAAACVAAGVGPLVLIGMIDAQGRAGRIGGGVVDVPVALFVRTQDQG